MKKRAIVNIFPKPEVLDPQGRALEKSLVRKSVQAEVLVGKVIQLESDDLTSEKLDQICQDFLVNTLTETYSFTLDDIKDEDLKDHQKKA